MTVARRADLLTRAEAAAYLGVSKEWFSQHRHDGPRRVEMGRKLYYLQGDLEDYVTSDLDPSDVRARGFVYLLQAGAYVKIGWALRPKDRAIVLQTGCPYKIVVVSQVAGSQAFERKLHLRFSESRVRGAEYHERGEWFHDVPEIRSCFSAMQDRPS